MSYTYIISFSATVNLYLYKYTLFFVKSNAWGDLINFYVSLIVWFRNIQKNVGKFFFVKSIIAFSIDFT